MSERRFTFMAVWGIAGHRPAQGLGALPRRRRGALGDTSRNPEGDAKPTHACSSGARGQRHGPDRRAHHRRGRLSAFGIGLGSAARAREADRACGGCSRHPPWFPEPRSPAAKLLNILAQRSDYPRAALAPLVPLATVPRPISSGFPGVFDPHNLSQQRAADARFRPHYQRLGQWSWSDPRLPGLSVFGRFSMVSLQARSAPGLAGGTGSSPPARPAKAGRAA